ncbi:hypothetical protein NBH00_15695 [Paraconexibacter antarcticus]|uniref:Lipoprotein n=1 Tax=Paraconexibacter antarcticus TaxID=2949664 RepID=A0ABY5DMZ3_9ACTN|nr:hypothetical protein [Paraconexibacter antarcticus]UTI62800.1 hypothetical protein NBH00_15695 [Paraconexibacter antarcticus]
MHCLRTYTSAAAVVGLLAAVGASGCDEGHTTSPAAGASSGAAGGAPRGPGATMSLVRAPKQRGEVLVSGPGSPEAHGPYVFHGRYTVRFEQADPEDPRQTFAGQTAFVAYAAPQQDQADGPGVVRLARAAKRTGTTTVRLDGRLWVNVSFGDFPYALRLTPVRGG